MKLWGVAYGFFFILDVYDQPYVGTHSTLSQVAKGTLQ